MMFPVTDSVAHALRTKTTDLYRPHERSCPAIYLSDGMEINGVQSQPEVRSLPSGALFKVASETPLALLNTDTLGCSSIVYMCVERLTVSSPSQRRY